MLRAPRGGARAHRDAGDAGGRRSCGAGAGTDAAGAERAALERAPDLRLLAGAAAGSGELSGRPARVRRRGPRLGPRARLARGAPLADGRGRRLGPEVVEDLVQPERRQAPVAVPGGARERPVLDPAREPFAGAIRVGLREGRALL